MDSEDFVGQWVIFKGLRRLANHRVRPNYGASHVLNSRAMVLIDVGVRGGFHPRWDKYPLTKIGVDADAAGLPGGKGRFIEAALWNTAGPQTLYLTRKRECSSLYRPNHAYLAHFADAERFAVEATPTVNCTTLDALGIDPEDGVILKIDAQGAEANILRGGTRLMPHVVLAELETYFAPAYEHAPMFPEIHAAMSDYGLSLLTVRRFFSRAKDGVPHLMFGEALYGRLGHASLPTLAGRYSAVPRWTRFARSLMCERRVFGNPFQAILQTGAQHYADAE